MGDHQYSLPYCYVIMLLIAGPTSILLPDTGLHVAEATSQTKCTHNLEHTTANCSGLNLEQVPWGLHYNIEILDLSNNRFTGLVPYAFKTHGYTSLKVLYLRNNSIINIHVEAFLKLDSLHTLDLSNNMLNAVPSEALYVLPYLHNLNLASNNLMLIPDFAFQGIPTLKQLDLSGNRISDFETKALSGLTSLQILWLQKNSLHSLHPDTFRNISDNLLQVHLYDNPWNCDCRIRWLREWMENDTNAVWNIPGNPVRCSGPYNNQGKSIRSVPLDELACKVEMRTSGSRQSVNKGTDAVLECIYFSIPSASPTWLVGDMPIDFKQKSEKYAMTVEGSPTTTTRLYIKNFEYDDIREYECFAQNVRGTASTIYKVTLTGVDFDKVTHTPIGGLTQAGVDTKSIVIAVAVVCGIILTVVLGVLVFCTINHIQRKQEERRQTVRENVKKHFLANGESFSKESKQPDKTAMEQINEDTKPDLNKANGTGSMQFKQPGDLECTNEAEPLYTFQQPSSPFANGNTYVSFSEVAVPELVSAYPKLQNTRHEDSHAESTTPLLDHYAPVFDSEDPLDDSAIYSVYESATYHPRRNYYPSVNSSVPLTPGSIRSGSMAPRHPDYQDYREMQYPFYTNPPPPRTLSTKKSMSVGNLGYLPPRKPPRSFHSREYVEMSPHDTSGSASDYMTMSHSPYYGVKPGTPV